MIDIDETIRRIYTNPYESEPRPKKVCRHCGIGIYAGDKRKETCYGMVCGTCGGKQNK